MKKSLIVILILFFFLPLLVFSEPVFYVSKVRNLRLRENPDLQAKVIKLLGICEKIEYIETSQTCYTVESDGEKITAPWIKVITKDGAMGWIWSGFASKLVRYTNNEMKFSFLYPEEFIDENSVRKLSSDKILRIHFETYRIFIETSDIMKFGEHEPGYDLTPESEEYHKSYATKKMLAIKNSTFTNDSKRMIRFVSFPDRKINGIFDFDYSDWNEFPSVKLEYSFITYIDSYRILVKLIAPKKPFFYTLPQIGLCLTYIYKKDYDYIMNSTTINQEDKVFIKSIYSTESTMEVLGDHVYKSGYGYDNQTLMKISEIIIKSGMIKGFNCSKQYFPLEWGSPKAPLDFYNAMINDKTSDAVAYWYHTMDIITDSFTIDNKE